VANPQLAAKYAQWIVANAARKGTPEFATVAAAYKDAMDESAPDPIQAQPLDAGAPISPTADTIRDPNLQGLIATAPAYTPPAPQPTLTDRIVAIPGVRALGGAINTAYGIGQGAAHLVGNAADAVGLDAGPTRAIERNLGQRIAQNDATVQHSQATTENPLDAPFNWIPGYKDANIAGMVGSAVPYLAVPVGPEGAGFLAAGGRVASNVALGAGAGYLAPQAGEYSQEQANANAGVGALAGGLFSGTAEGLRGAYQYLTHLVGDNAARVIADSAGDRLPEVVQAIHEHQNPLPGAAPNAGRMAVSADVPNFQGLVDAVKDVKPNTSMQGDMATAMAQQEAAQRIQAGINSQRAGQPVAEGAPAAVPAYGPPPEVPFRELGARAGETLDAHQAAIDAAAQTAAEQEAAIAQRQGLANEGVRASKANLTVEAEQAKAAQRQQQAAIEQQIRGEAAARVSALEGARAQTLEQQLADIEAQKQAAEAEAQRTAASIPEADTASVGVRVKAAVDSLVKITRKYVTGPLYDHAFTLAGDARMPVPDAVKAAGDVNVQAAFDASLAPEVDKALVYKVFGPDEGQSSLSLKEFDQARQAVNLALRKAESSQSPDAEVLARNLRITKNALDADFEKAPFSQEAKDAYRTAVQTYAQEVGERFGGDVTRRLRVEGRIGDSQVIDALFQKGGRVDSANEFVTSVQNTQRVLASEGSAPAQKAADEAVQAVRQGIEDKFRREVVDPITGKIDVNKATRFLSRDGVHGRQIDTLETVMPGLRQSLEGYRDAARTAQMTVRRLDETAKDLPRRLSEQTRAEVARVKAEAETKLSAARQELDRLSQQWKQEVRAQSERIRLAGEDTRSALAQHLEQQKAEAQRVVDEAKARLDEAKANVSKLKFTDGEKMFTQVMNDETARQQVLTNMTSNERKALATRLEWEINRLTKPEARLKYLGENERAVKEVFRAADPQTANARLDAFRQKAEDEFRQMQARGDAPGANPLDAVQARLDSLRSKINEVLAPPTGINRARYEADKGNHLTNDQRAEIDRLAEDIAQQQLMAAQASRAGRDYRSILDVHTRYMQNHGELVPTLTQPGMIIRFIQKIVGQRLNKATQERLAQILLEGSKEDVIGALQQGQQVIDRENAVRNAVTGAQRLAVPAISQQSARQQGQQ
jgi:hypothetical protein